MIRRNGYGSAWRNLPVIIVVLLMMMGCNGKSSITTLGSEKENLPSMADPGILHDIFWYQPYQVVDDDPYIDERNVDITNIVYGCRMQQPPWHVEAGRIKQMGMPNPLVGTVAVWQEPVYDGEEIDEWNICFAMLYAEDLGGPPEDYEVIGAINHFGENDGLHQIQPAISAFLDVEEVGQTWFFYVFVDIVYMQRDADNPDDNWEIWHCRFRQTYEDNDVFHQVGFPTPVSDTQLLVNCVRPDIVFDAGYPDPLQGVQRLHVVCQVDVLYDDRQIWYRMATDSAGNITWAPPGTAYRCISVDTPGLNERPRIDIGFDDSGYFPLFPGPNPPTNYYLCVVWQHGDFITEGEVSDWQFDIVLGVLAPEGYILGNLLTEYVSVGHLGDFNVFPHIEISPIENGSFGNNPVRTAFITWTHAVDAFPPEHQFHVVEIQSTNSFRFLFHGNPIPLFNGDGDYDPGGRNGCAVFANCFGNDMIQKGALVWLNDLYDPEHPNEEYLVTVWGGQVKFTPLGEIWPQGDPEYSPTLISQGESSWNHPNYTFGPEAAIYQNILVKCIWTDLDEVEPESFDTGIHGNTDIMTYG